jgi:hypothetical protein
LVIVTNLLHILACNIWTPPKENNLVEEEEEEEEEEEVSFIVDYKWLSNLTLNPHVDTMFIILQKSIHVYSG